MTLNTNISKIVSHSTINNTIFWKYVTIPFRYIYLNCFNRLRLLAEVSTKFQKMSFLDNLRTITQEGNMATRQMTSFFFIYFLRSVCNIHFWIWKYSKFIFVWSSFGPFWSVKYLNFWPKATDSDSSSHFSRK